MWPSQHVNRMTFKSRTFSLRMLEGHLIDRQAPFILSTRHKDMLRCSKTKHFRSCYSIDGANRHVPFELCTKPTFAIIGEKDRAGDFIWRAFVEHRVEKDHYYTSSSYTVLMIFKMYGNPPPDIREKLIIHLDGLVGRVSFSSQDAY